MIVCDESKSFIDTLDIKLKIITKQDIVLTNYKHNIKSKYLYIMLTSGTTGKPKAIPIKEDNLLNYIIFTINKFNINQNDVVSQTFDISFDLSIHDIFTTFLSGARLVPIQKEHLFIPNKIIKKEKITIWFSVPSIIIYMNKLGLLKDRFETIRLSLFCGEALSTYIAEKWQKCIYNTDVYNLYGPTETTIAIFYHKLKPKKYKTSTIPIGKIFDNNEYLIKDNELLIAGEQIFDGYLNSTDNFEIIDNKNYYKTGDLVKETKFGLLYNGRIDEQIKLNGYRIELTEIENKIRQKGIVCACIFDERDNCLVLFSEIKVDIEGLFPKYMQPKKVIVIDKLPLNINGKFDKNKLKEKLWKN